MAAATAMVMSQVDVGPLVMVVGPVVMVVSGAGGDGCDGGGGCGCGKGVD